MPSLLGLPASRATMLQTAASRICWYGRSTERRHIVASDETLSRSLDCLLKRRFGQSNRHDMVLGECLRTLAARQLYPRPASVEQDILATMMRGILLVGKRVARMGEPPQLSSQEQSFTIPARPEMSTGIRGHLLVREHAGQDNPISYRPWRQPRDGSPQKKCQSGVADWHFVGNCFLLICSLPGESHLFDVRNDYFF